MLRPRMVSTALLVLIALGGAGLAVAADRQQNAVQRPELTWPADHAAQPMIGALVASLRTVDASTTSVSQAGREVLGQLQALDIEKMRTALADGDRAAADTDTALLDLAAARSAANQGIERWRLGPQTAEVLAALDTAAASAASVPGDWSRIEARASTVSSLVDDLLRHDGLIFRATTYGRQGNWGDALTALDDGQAPLDDARRMRDDLAATATVSTLSDLIERYDAYDAALRALYQYVSDTGRQSGSAFDDLQADVDRTQSALPADNRALTVIVGEAAGNEITDALVALEVARGDINAALNAAEPQP